MPTLPLNTVSLESGLATAMVTASTTATWSYATWRHSQPGPVLLRTKPSDACDRALRLRGHPRRAQRVIHQHAISSVAWSSVSAAEALSESRLDEQAAVVQAPLPATASSPVPSHSRLALIERRM